MAQKQAPGAMVTVGVPMPRKTKERLKAAARLEGLSLAPWMRRIAMKAAEEALR